MLQDAKVLKRHTAHIYSAPQTDSPLHQGVAMPVRSRVKVLLYRRNAERAAVGEKPFTLRGVSRATGIAYSALRKLADNETARIDFYTPDKLMQFFDVDSLDEILEYKREMP